MSKRAKAKKRRKKYIFNCGRLDYLMKKFNFSNIVLSDMMKVNKTAVNGWRCGHHNPKMSNIYKLAEIFEVDPNYFLENDAKISQNYLRFAIYKTVEQPIAATDYQGLISIMNALGLTVKDLPKPVQVQEKREPTEAENDLLEKVLNGATQSEAPETTESEN